MAKRCYYDVLGVQRGARDSEVKAAFRNLAKECHPDRCNGDPNAETRFKELNEAYEALKDPQRRAAYDRFGHAAFDPALGGGGGRHGFGADFSASMSAMFDDLFGEFMGQRRPRQRSGARARLRSPLQHGDHARARPIRARRRRSACRHPSPAKAARARGAKAGTSPTLLPHLRRHRQGARDARASSPSSAPVPTCQGRGETIETPCPSCNGAGRVTRERTLSVTIPIGVEDGTRIRLAGEGEAGLRGGPPGDLYIFLSIKPHEFFQRDGADLFCRVPIAMTTAALGGQIEVPTIDGGRTRVKIPEGTESGKQFRLKAKGMPVLRSKQQGDLYIQVEVETPKNLSRKQRDLLKAFEDASNPSTSPASTGFFARVKEFFEGIGE